MEDTPREQECTEEQTSVPSDAEPSGPAPEVDATIVSFRDPNTILSEWFKQLRILIEGAIRAQKHYTVGFTSAVRGEGKTTVALNYAAAMARDPELKVAVVDGDLRHPSVHHRFGLRPKCGLSDVLSNGTELNDVLLDTPVPNLRLVPGGSPTHNSAELIASTRKMGIMLELEERFDRVIFDTAPILLVADSVYLIPKLNGTVFIVEAGKTSKRRVMRALELVKGANMLGFVLNKMRGGMAEYGYPNYHDYYYVYK